MFDDSYISVALVFHIFAATQNNLAYNDACSENFCHAVHAGNVCTAVPLHSFGETPQDLEEVSKILGWQSSQCCTDVGYVLSRHHACRAAGSCVSLSDGPTVTSGHCRHALALP